jgi:putative sterol carrier protein
MTIDIFSDAWATAWCRELNQSAAYKDAAAGWQGGVALVMQQPADGIVRSVYLDTGDGTCLGARAASDGDVESATYVFEATAEQWQQLFSGAVAPANALFSGKLRLTRGNLATLLPYARAAGELIATAGSVPARFPGAA